MAAYSIDKIENVYGTVFANILAERISTAPVVVVTPFSWIDKQGNRIKTTKGG